MFRQANIKHNVSHASFLFFPPPIINKYIKRRKAAMIDEALIVAIVIVVMLAVIALCFHAHALRDLKRKKKIREQHEERQRRQMERWQQYVDTTLTQSIDEESGLPPAYYENASDAPQEERSTVTAPALPPPSYKNHTRDLRIR
ncbi:hypothetical protein BJV82DRAFT_715470 [Fennellomyces sp. T-0311]|nr:hypothetical protein BJV82DRAFT_715470 [Fennellomyces sp. T-0311]